MAFQALTRTLRASSSSLVPHARRFATVVPDLVTAEDATAELENELWPGEAESVELISKLSNGQVEKTTNSSPWTVDETNNTIYLQLNNLVPRKPSEPRASRQVISLVPSVFAHPLRTDILHSCVVWHLDSLRQGTAKSKSRYEVSASNKKLRPQKGSGRARLRDAGSPMLRGGGRAWPKIPRDFSTKLNRKVREMGLRVVLSAKLREHNLEVVPSIRGWHSKKTNDLERRLKTKGWAADRTLLVLGGEMLPTNLELATRNLQNVHVMLAQDLNVYDALWWKRLILDVDAVGYFSERLGNLGVDHPDDLTSEVLLHPALAPRTLRPPVGALLPLHSYFPLYAARV